MMCWPRVQWARKSRGFYEMAGGGEVGQGAEFSLESP